MSPPTVLPSLHILGLSPAGPPCTTVKVEYHTAPRVAVHIDSDGNDTLRGHAGEVPCQSESNGQCMTSLVHFGAQAASMCPVYGHHLCVACVK